MLAGGDRVGQILHRALTYDGPPLLLYCLLQRQHPQLRSTLMEVLVFLTRHAVTLTPEMQ